MNSTIAVAFRQRAMGNGQQKTNNSQALASLSPPKCYPLSSPDLPIHTTGCATGRHGRGDLHPKCHKSY
ncbi:MAG: hypothetical protein WBI34_10395 [Tenuifilaceae bacterium]